MLKVMKLTGGGVFSLTSQRNDHILLHCSGSRQGQVPSTCCRKSSESERGVPPFSHLVKWGFSPFYTPSTVQVWWILLLLLHIRKLRHRAVISLAQGHSGSLAPSSSKLPPVSPAPISWASLRVKCVIRTQICVIQYRRHQPHVAAGSLKNSQ